MTRYRPVSVRKRWPTFVRSSCMPAFPCADLCPAWFVDSGMAHWLDVLRPFDSESGNGWIGIETVLVRLEDSYAPNASFPVWSEDPIGDASGFVSRIGYDAVICVEMHEPWIVQIYNSSLGVPTTMAIVGKSATTDFEPDDGNRGQRLDSYTRTLNSTGKTIPFYFRYASGFPFERY